VYAMPMHYAIATTHPPDVAERQRLIKKYSGDTIRALAEFAQRYPNGVEGPDSEPPSNDDGTEEWATGSEDFKSRWTSDDPAPQEEEQVS
jgi:hypothetical protein